MVRITSQPVPQGTLLCRHADLPGVQSDAHVATVPGQVALAEFVAAFLTSRAYAPEALILRLMLRRPTGAEAVTALARSQTHRYAAWQVETRTETELLMAVGTGPIRSWWSVRWLATGETQLWFGSAILPVATGARVPLLFRILNRFHLTYARILLWGAVKTLRAPAAKTGAR